MSACGGGAGPNCRLEVCTVGRRCVLGANVVVKDSHLWDDVTIEDNAVSSRGSQAGSESNGGA